MVIIRNIMIPLWKRSSTEHIYLMLRRRIAEQFESPNPFRREVEVDVSYFGPRRFRGKRGRDASGKNIVYGIFKRDGRV